MQVIACVRLCVFWCLSTCVCLCVQRCVYVQVTVCAPYAIECLGNLLFFFLCTHPAQAAHQSSLAYQHDQTHTHTYMHAGIYTRTQTPAHTRAYTPTYIHIHTCTLADKHTSINTHTGLMHAVCRHSRSCASLSLSLSLSFRVPLVHSPFSICLPLFHAFADANLYGQLVCSAKQTCKRRTPTPPWRNWCATTSTTSTTGSSSSSLLLRRLLGPRRPSRLALLINTERDIQLAWNLLSECRERERRERMSLCKTVLCMPMPIPVPLSPLRCVCVCVPQAGRYLSPRPPLPLLLLLLLRLLVLYLPTGCRPHRSLWAARIGSQGQPVRGHLQ
jgi:hypothetical protein